jgi:hypothetical protein
MPIPTSTYTLDMDIPVSELEELGWDKTRSIRHVRAYEQFNSKSNLMLERVTGTLMLNPIQMQPDLWYTNGYDSLRVPLTDLDYAPGKWQQHPITQVGGTQFMLRSQLGPTSLISALVDASLVALGSAAVASTAMHPILATKTEYPINQGVCVKIETKGQVGQFKKDYLAIQIGDFILKLDTDGTSELHWSSDGTMSENSWVFRKMCGSPVDARSGGKVVGPSLNTVGVVTSQAALEIFFIPFGRGNILIRIRGNGQTHDTVYTHKEAAWNASEGRYRITKAGKVVVRAKPTVNANFSLQISKIGYPTSGEWTDSQFGIPYAPSTLAAVTTSWTKTMGSPDVTAALLDEAGDPWVADGVKKKVAVKFTLSGDGTCSPFVDVYKIHFPEKVVTKTPSGRFTIPMHVIQEMEIEDGESWDEQRITITLKDDLTDPRITAISRRSEINGQLLVDGVPYGIYRFTKPRTVVGKKFNMMTLKGRNLGAARLDEKTFQFAPPFGGGLQHVVVRDVLMLCGWPSSDILVDTDTVTLPVTEKHNTDRDETELKWQPGFNTPVREFLDDLREKFSNWPLRYKSDGKWHYKRPLLPSEMTIQGTFFIDKYPMIERDTLYLEPEPPEANLIMMIGRDDSGNILMNMAIDKGSQSSTAETKPWNFIDRIKELKIIDTDLNTLEGLTVCLELAADRLFEAPVWVGWKAPFISAIKIDDVWTVEGLGAVQIKSFSSDAKGPRELENTASTYYIGKLVQA